MCIAKLQTYGKIKLESILNLTRHQFLKIPSKSFSFHTGELISHVPCLVRVLSSLGGSKLYNLLPVPRLILLNGVLFLFLYSILHVRHWSDMNMNVVNVGYCVNYVHLWKKSVTVKMRIEYFALHFALSVILYVFIILCSVHCKM